ncbi:MAG: 30S ribosomal protein S5 [Patescibacteria group bacterium]|mgnify:CR=1 FL=1
MNNPNNNSRFQKTDNRRGGKFNRPPKEKSEFDSRMLDLARVARVTKGGKRFSFRATMVVGDGKGRVGVGVAQGHDVQQAMEKSTQNAKKRLLRVVIVKGTIPHQVTFKYHSAVVMIKPSPMGSGVKAGGPVRVIAKLAGISNITAKLIERTGNKINIARATIGALGQLKQHATSPSQANS